MASIKKSEGDIVEGVVYQISKEDLDKLDKYEALGKRYLRKKIFVTKPGKIKRLVWTYIAIGNHMKNYPPSGEYLDLILTSAKYHKLSKNYINKIKEG